MPTMSGCVLQTLTIQRAVFMRAVRGVCEHPVYFSQIAVHIHKYFLPIFLCPAYLAARKPCEHLGSFLYLYNTTFFYIFQLFFQKIKKPTFHSRLKLTPPFHPQRSPYTKFHRSLHRPSPLRCHRKST